MMRLMRCHLVFNVANRIVWSPSKMLMMMLMIMLLMMLMMMMDFGGFPPKSSFDKIQISGLCLNTFQHN